MSAVAILEAAADADLDISLDGDKLVILAAGEPPGGLLAGIKAHKAEIVELLRQEAARYEPDAVNIDQATVDKYEAVEAEFQRQLAALKIDNARIYANPTPWKIK
jgi:hypothetical protein